MRRIIEIFKSKKGNMLPLAIAITLSIIIISCGIFEYVRLMVIAHGVRDSVQSAIISVATGNYANVYSALREGYSGGYSLSGNNWNEQLDTGDIYGRLDSLLGLKSENGYHVKYIDDKIMEYRLSNLNINIINAAFAPSDSDMYDEFLAEATIDLEAPLSFGWHNLTPMKITLKCKAGYTAKF